MIKLSSIVSVGDDFLELQKIMKNEKM